ncbi:hypothetical protein [Methyloglobulus sp.]|uniref:hypothetical protein n=1 Tax=Methyloglobulus sp. TaxID=2518622 RepID=UPI003988DE35
MDIEVVRTCDEFSQELWILKELGQCLQQLRDNPIYLTSIPHYLLNAAYKFITLARVQHLAGLRCWYRLIFFNFIGLLPKFY